LSVKFARKYLTRSVLFVCGVRTVFLRSLYRLALLYDALIVQFTEATNRWVSRSKSNFYPLFLHWWYVTYLHYLGVWICFGKDATVKLLLYVIIGHEFKYEKSLFYF